MLPGEHAFDLTRVVASLERPSVRRANTTAAAVCANDNCREMLVFVRVTEWRANLYRDGTYSLGDFIVFLYLLHHFYALKYARPSCKWNSIQGAQHGEPEKWLEIVSHR